MTSRDKRLRRAERETEAVVRDLIEAHLADDARAAALDWLEKRVVVYQAVQSLRLLDGDEY
jgi:hypothetical protein